MPHKFPARVKTKTEAAALINALMPPPAKPGLYLSYAGQFENTLAVCIAEGRTTEAMRELLAWLMTQPKIHKIAQQEIAFRASRRFEDLMKEYRWAFSALHAREQTPAVTACMAAHDDDDG